MTQILKTKISECVKITENALAEIIDSYRKNNLFTPELSSVIDSAEYSLLAGGKRLRPFLVHCFCKLCGGDVSSAVIPALALEMIHTYSLIHDDLPCMDNDDVRRGKPTNHKVFGEATAVLAGDALLTEAFGLICKCNLSDSAKLKMIEILSQKAGILGMIGGQEIDLKSEGKVITEETLYKLQSKKTGMLFEAACLLGCIASGYFTEEQLLAASNFAHHFGLAFQISDDILDVSGSTEELGKTVGSDERAKKYTFVTFLGIEGAKIEAKKQCNLAKDCLIKTFNSEKAKLLCELCDYMVIRRN